MGSTWGIQSVNMTCTRLTFILAVLIAPACSTSVGFAIKKRWSAAGCSGTDTLIYDKIQTGKGPTDGSCNEEVGDTPTAYEKTTCTANTATDGYSNGDYTDAGCTTLVAGEVLTTKPTNECVTNTGSVTEYETWVCGTTSPTLGGVYFQQYNAAGCPDSNRTSAGYFAVNYCKKGSTNGAWKDSSKDVIENGKIQTYEWEDSSTFSTTERLAAKGCTGGGSLVQDGRADRWSEHRWLFDSFREHRNFGCNFCIPWGCVHCAQFDVLLIGANQLCAYGIGICLSSEENTWSNNVINSKQDYTTSIVYKYTIFIP